MLSNRIEKESQLNEFARVDAALKKSIVHVESVQNQLEVLEDLEHGLESLFRLMIKTRVSLLNILNRYIEWDDSGVSCIGIQKIL